MSRWALEAPPPVEYRLLGLDRRLILPTLGVYLVVLLWNAVMPAVDQAVDAREIEPGTVYDVGPARFTPSPGWVLVEPPSPVGTSTSVAVFGSGVTLRVKGGSWNQDADALLERVSGDQREFIVEGPTYRVKTSAGVVGAARRITGPDYAGLLIAYVDGGTGVEVVVKGPVETSERLAQPIAGMIQSIEFESRGGGAQ